MKITSATLLLFYFFSTLAAQKITLHGQVLFSGTEGPEVGLCTIQLSEEKAVATDQAGFFNLEFDQKDTNTLFQIKSIRCNSKELQIVNLHQIEHLLIEEKLEDTLILLYVMQKNEWNKRKFKIEKIYLKQYPINLQRIVTNSDNYYKGYSEHLEKVIRNEFPKYKNWMIDNILSTPENQLSEKGQKTYVLLLNRKISLDEAIQVLGNTVHLDTEEGRADLHLLAKLQIQNFDLEEAMRQYFKLIEYDSSDLGILMEYKHLMILKGYPELVEGRLGDIVKRVKDDVFLARNYSDLAWIHDHYGEWDKAIAASHMALSYLYKLENKYPEEYWFEVTTELLNLADTYNDMKTEDSLALVLFDSVSQRIVQQPEWKTDQELMVMYFFANGMVGHLLSKARSIREAYPYYERMFMEYALDAVIAKGYPKNLLLSEYLNFCEGKELYELAKEEVDRCYAGSLHVIEARGKTKKQSFDRSSIFAKIAQIKQAEQDNAAALKYYKKALEVVEEDQSTQPTKVSVNLHISIAKMLELHGIQDRALNHFGQALDNANYLYNYNWDEAKRHLGITFYNKGIFYKNQLKRDSALISYSRAQEELNQVKNSTEADIALRGNIYQHTGNLWGESGIVILADIDLLKAIDLFSQLADKGHEEYNLNVAECTAQLLSIHSEYPEMLNKHDAITLIDNALFRLQLPGLDPDEVKHYGDDMRNFRKIVSGERGEFNMALLTFGPLVNQRNRIAGNHHKSLLQVRIVEKLQQALDHSPPRRFKEITKALAIQTGNLAWYAIFDRNYVLAEASARKALTIDSTKVAFNTYIAHSLLFQNRIAEAKTLYQELKDQIHSNYQTFGYYFVKEIYEMRKAGIEHERFDEILDMLVR